MMGDSLEIFGNEYENVAGFKVKDSNGNTLTYTRGGGGGNDFVITLSKNSQTGYWEPNKTYAEISAAYTAGKTIACCAYDEYDTQLETQCYFGSKFYYEVGEWDAEGEPIYYLTWYGMDANGIIPQTPNPLGPPTMLGTKTITANGTYNALNVDSLDGYSEVTVNVPSSSPTLQSKTATPSESQQTISPDSGYDGLSSVTVNAISSTYVGTGIDRNDSTDLTVSAATVSVPAGYYESAASKAVASGTATTPATTITANPAISVSASGLITATASASQSVTPTVSAGYVSSGTAGDISVSGTNTQQLSVQAATTITPTKSSQTAVASGKYTTGAVTVAAIPAAYQDVTGVTAAASDVVSGKDIVNSSGTVVHGSLVIQHYYTGSSTPSSSLGVDGDIYLQTGG